MKTSGTASSEDISPEGINIERRFLQVKEPHQRHVQHAGIRPQQQNVGKCLQIGGRDKRSYRQQGDRLAEWYIGSDDQECEHDPHDRCANGRRERGLQRVGKRMQKPPLFENRGQEIEIERTAFNRRPDKKPSDRQQDKCCRQKANRRGGHTVRSEGHDISRLESANRTWINRNDASFCPKGPFTCP
jgi:hypothetical protein